MVISAVLLESSSGVLGLVLGGDHVWSHPPLLFSPLEPSFGFYHTQNYFLECHQ